MQHTRYGKLTRTKSGQAAVKSTEKQTWLRDSFSFLRGHIRRKRVSKSSAFKSPLRPSGATVSFPNTSRETKSEMEISMASDVTHQLSTTSPSHRPAAVATTTAEDPVSDQFQQMRSMISSSLCGCQDTTPNPRQSFCLYSEIEHLEERDFLTFRNETVKLLSGIKYKAKEYTREVTKAQVTIFQLPEATQATAGREYILTIPDTQQVSTPAVQPTQMAAPHQPTVIAKVQQPQRSASASSQPASFIIVDDQQPGPSRQLMFALGPTKIFNTLSVASGQQEDSQHNTSGLSSLFGSIPSVLQYQQINTPQPFSPSQLQPSPVPTTNSKNKQDLTAIPASRVSPNQQISLH